ncbi:MAG: PEP-CTERM sorting domain-containing protein [Candidatus Binatia bacterium]
MRSHPWNMLRIWHLLLVTFFVLLGGLQHTHAGLITFAYTGEVTEVTGPASPFSNPITAGDSFSGSYTFDMNVADSDPSEGRGFYNQTAVPGTSFSVNFFGETVLLPLSHIQVIVPTVTEIYNVFAETPSSTPAFPNFEFSLVGFIFHPLPAPAFVTEALPLLPPDLAQFSTFRPFVLAGSDGTSSFRIQGSISSLNLNQVSALPEPSTWLLVVAGLGGIALRQRQKHRWRA